jgi:hypothetical protein
MTQSSSAPGTRKPQRPSRQCMFIRHDHFQEPRHDGGLPAYCGHTCSTAGILWSALSVALCGQVLRTGILRPEKRVCKVIAGHAGRCSIVHLTVLTLTDKVTAQSHQKFQIQHQHYTRDMHKGALHHADVSSAGGWLMEFAAVCVARNNRFNTNSLVCSAGSCLVTTRLTHQPCQHMVTCLTSSLPVTSQP